MRRDYRKNQIFNRRTLILGGIKSSLTALLVARLGYLQLIKHKEYSTRADSNRIRPSIIPSARGLILDRNNVSLTQNNQSYRLLLYLENKSDVKKTLTTLAKILNLNQNTLQIMFKRVKNARRKSIISLTDNLLWDDLARIEVNSYKLPGISIEDGLIRRYNFPYETAHLVGYVSSPSEKEIKNDQQALYMHPDFRIGKSGVEKTFDNYLRGRFGIKYVEVNAFGIPIRTLSKKDSLDGKKLNLTIDLNLQKFTTEKIKNHVASVVVMDVKTGEILTLASSPSFNPNNFVEGVSVEYWQELINNHKKPLNNKPISAIYPPGSTFKLMVALAALENGINPTDKIFCNGKYRLGKRTFHCWKKRGHGKINMIDAIAQSCNSYFFHIAHIIGIEKITQTAKRFGYSEVFDIDLGSVASGNLPTKEWKKKVFNKKWVGGDTLNSAIGQGFVLATPLQLAVSTARIANGGVAINPVLIKNQESQNQYEKLKNKELTKNNYLNILLEGMNKEVNKKKGTAYYRRIRSKNFAMSGKTGTSQVVSKREDEMTEEELLKNQNHSIFVGFAPTHQPKYAISVVVEHGGSGSKTATPIARDVLLKTQKLIS